MKLIGDRFSWVQSNLNVNYNFVDTQLLVHVKICCTRTKKNPHRFYWSPTQIGSKIEIEIYIFGSAKIIAIILEFRIYQLNRAHYNVWLVGGECASEFNMEKVLLDWKIDWEIIKIFENDIGWACKIAHV